MAAVTPSDEAGQAFGGRYRLVEFVGEGTDARVYVAEDLTLLRRVALKILRVDSAADEAFLQRFAIQMRATAALHHPRVLPVHDWGTDPQPYAVTEYLTGGSLAAMIAAGHHLTPSQALDVGLEAARALTNIHAGGRAHLGLKPSSILFDSVGRPYISDLGLAAALAAADPVGTTANAAGDDEADPGEDAADSPRIAAAYSAEQQAQDIADLAVLLGEAVTGTRLLTLGDGSEMATVSALGPLAGVLERATVADAAERPTAAGFARELLGVAPLLPRPDPLVLASQDAPAEPDGAYLDGTERLEQVGPSVSERSAIPLDDVPRRRWPSIALAAIVVLGGAAAGAWAWIASGGSSEAVPDLAGQQRTEAASAAEESGWHLNEILVREAGTVDGEIVRTEPEARTQLATGETLNVYVSLGEPLVPLSELDGIYGMTVPDAAGAIAAAGLRHEGETLVNDEAVPAGNVVGVDVEAGVHELEVGAEVRLRISEGPADRTVPNVTTDLTDDDAVELLAALKLTPRIVRRFDPDVPERAVIAFSPPSGETVPVETMVDVLVSRGPYPVAVEESDPVESEQEDSGDAS